MKTFLQGVVLISLFVMANVVAAGVILVLGKTLQAVAPTWTSPWPWLLICWAGALAAIGFVRWTMLFAERGQSFFGLRDPHKGLECRSARRGG